jgi:hypothetical protein
MYERALVPLDGSIVAEGVIPFILQTAGPLDLDVTLLRVVVPAPPAVVEGGPSSSPIPRNSAPRLKYIWRRLPPSSAPTACA